MIKLTQLAALPGLELVHRGKVRDTYALAEDLMMVASDRISAFDVVLPTPIPGKGVILTQLSVFWFALTGGLVPNHLITAEIAEMPLPATVPVAPLRGRSLLVRRATRIDVECVVRGYLAGSGWEEYRLNETLGDEPLPSGLRFGDRLPEPRFTPALKVENGHDVNIARADVADRYGTEISDQLEQASLNLYLAASELAFERGLILADTKFEFGFIDERLTLIDEALTPDSSRYWDRDAWAPGHSPPSFDKQYVRDFLAGSGWDKEPPAPDLPPDVVAGTQGRYAEALRRLTGREAAVDEETAPA